MPSTASRMLDGLSTSVAVKAPCIAVATSNITLSGLQTVNGVVLVADDRVLCVGQTNPVLNGIYNASTGTWTRALDADGNRDLVRGTRVLVRSSTTAGVEYELTTANPIVIGTTSLVFELRYGANALYDQTAGEIAASAIPVNKQYEPGWTIRYQTNTTPGTTDMSDAFQKALDSSSGTYVVQFVEENTIAKTLILKDTVQAPVLRGRSRVVSLISPKAVSIKQAPENTECLLYNKANNGHPQFESFRFYSVVGFTGVAIYCKEGGGGDGSAQCMFSALLHNGWCSLASTNTGFMQGGLQNSVVDSYIYETMKGIFIIEGVGNSDNHYRNISLFNCFDQFMLQTADTNGSTMLTVDGIHSYSHNRGYLFDVKNWIDCDVSNITLQPASGNLGNCGIGRWTDALGLTLTGLKARVSAGVPAGETILEFAGAAVTRAKVTDSYLTGNRAVKISATGQVFIEFSGCDFSTAGTNCFDTTGAVTSGTIITRNCKFNDSQLHAFAQTVNCGYNWYGYGDEFINSGLGGNAASRNLILNCSGEIVLTNPKIGRTSGGAAANFFIEAGGSGTVKLIHPTFVGTPPSGIKTGAQEVQIIYKPGFGADIASAAAIVIPNEGDVFNVTGVTNITSISAANMKGRRITLIFAGILTLTDGSNLKLAGNFVSTGDDAINLVCDGTNWYQASPGSVN